MPASEGEYISKKEEFNVFSDVIDVMNHPFSRNFQFAVATNQQGVGKKMYTREDVVNLHLQFLNMIGRTLNEFPIFICSHLEGDESCDCRKPKGGLLLSALEHFEVPLENAIFIGDKSSDAGAADSLGMDFCYLNRGLGLNLMIPGHPVAFEAREFTVGLLESFLK